MADLIRQQKATLLFRQPPQLWRSIRLPIGNIETHNFCPAPFRSFASAVAESSYYFDFVTKPEQAELGSERILA